MSNRYLVDTSAWIFALRRGANEAIRARFGELLRLDQLATCGIVALELVVGAKNENEVARIQMRLQAAERLSGEEDDWATAAHIGYSLRRRGVTVGAPDLLLAAVAIRNNIILLHADRDFDLIAAHSALRVESLVGLLSES